MAGTDITHANLLDAYPGATSATCDGHGNAEIICPPELGRSGYAACVACQRQRLLAAVSALVPARFRVPVALPEDVAAWTARGTDAQGLYLAGPVGTGKTHVAWTAVAVWCDVTGIRPTKGGAENGPSVIFTRMTDLLDDLRPGDDARKRVRDCQNAALLVLDDIGAEKASEWTQERLYSVIDHRYANCKPLIVTSNLPPSKLSDQAGERTASRLAEMCEVVPMTGQDRRKPAA